MNLERRTLKRAALPLAVVAGLGLSACAGTEYPEAPNNGVLEDMRIIGPSKSDYINAVNAGNEAIVYNPNTYQNIGSIAADEAFEIVCQTAKPNSFVIEYGDQTANVNFSTQIATDLARTGRTEVPSC